MRGSLDKINPGGDIDLTGTLQVSSIGDDKLVGVNVTDSDTDHSRGGMDEN